MVIATASGCASKRNATGHLRAGYSVRARPTSFCRSQCVRSPRPRSGRPLKRSSGSARRMPSRNAGSPSPPNSNSLRRPARERSSNFISSSAPPKPQSAKPPASQGFCDRIGKELRTLTGATATLDPSLDRQSRRAWAGTTWGAAGLTYPVAGRNYWLPRGAFFQVNRFLVDRLVELVTHSASGTLAWDLYAGGGPLHARAGGAVRAGHRRRRRRSRRHRARNVEDSRHPAALEHARLPARACSRPRTSLTDRARPAACRDWGAEAAQLLARIGAPEIVLVSCDPGTLALDLAHLTHYEIANVTLIDLFPQTSHIETITHLRKRSTDSA